MLLARGKHCRKLPVPQRTGSHCHPLSRAFASKNKKTSNGKGKKTGKDQKNGVESGVNAPNYEQEAIVQNVLKEFFGLGTPKDPSSAFRDLKIESQVSGLFQQTLDMGQSGGPAAMFHPDDLKYKDDVEQARQRLAKQLFEIRQTNPTLWESIWSFALRSTAEDQAEKERAKATEGVIPGTLTAPWQEGGSAATKQFLKELSEKIQHEEDLQQKYPEAEIEKENYKQELRELKEIQAGPEDEEEIREEMMKNRQDTEQEKNLKYLHKHLLSLDLAKLRPYAEFYRAREENDRKAKIEQFEREIMSGELLDQVSEDNAKEEYNPDEVVDELMEKLYKARIERAEQLRQQQGEESDRYSRRMKEIEEATQKERARVVESGKITARDRLKAVSKKVDEAKLIEDREQNSQPGLEALGLGKGQQGFNLGLSDSNEKPTSNFTAQPTQQPLELLREEQQQDEKVTKTIERLANLKDDEVEPLNSKGENLVKGIPPWPRAEEMADDILQKFESLRKSKPYERIPKIQKLIKAVEENPELSPEDKEETIRSLREMEKQEAVRQVRTHFVDEKDQRVLSLLKNEFPDIAKVHVDFREDLLKTLKNTRKFKSGNKYLDKLAQLMQGKKTKDDEIQKQVDIYERIKQIKSGPPSKEYEVDPEEKEKIMKLYRKASKIQDRDERDLAFRQLDVLLDPRMQEALQKRSRYFQSRLGSALEEHEEELDDTVGELTTLERQELLQMSDTDIFNELRSNFDQGNHLRFIRKHYRPDAEKRNKTFQWKYDTPDITNRVSFFSAHPTATFRAGLTEAVGAPGVPDVLFGKSHPGQNLTDEEAEAILSKADWLNSTKFVSSDDYEIVKDGKQDKQSRQAREQEFTDDGGEEEEGEQEENENVFSLSQAKEEEELNSLLEEEEEDVEIDAEFAEAISGAREPGSSYIDQIMSQRGKANAPELDDKESMKNRIERVTNGRMPDPIDAFTDPDDDMSDISIKGEPSSGVGRSQDTVLDPAKADPYYDSNFDDPEEKDVSPGVPPTIIEDLEGRMFVYTDEPGTPFIPPMGQTKAEQSGRRRNCRNMCIFCSGTNTDRPILEPLNINLLLKFMTPAGYIKNRYQNGLCRKMQSRVASTIKHARCLGLFSYKKGLFRIRNPFYSDQYDFLPAVNSEGFLDVSEGEEFERDSFRVTNPEFYLAGNPKDKEMKMFDPMSAITEKLKEADQFGDADRTDPQTFPDELDVDSEILSSAVNPETGEFDAKGLERQYYSNYSLDFGTVVAPYGLGMDPFPDDEDVPEIDDMEKYFTDKKSKESHSDFLNKDAETNDDENTDIEQELVKMSFGKGKPKGNTTTTSSKSTSNNKKGTNSNNFDTNNFGQDNNFSTSNIADKVNVSGEAAALDAILFNRDAQRKANIEKLKSAKLPEIGSPLPIPSEDEVGPEREFEEDAEDNDEAELGEESSWKEYKRFVRNNPKLKRDPEPMNDPNLAALNYHNANDYDLPPAKLLKKSREQTFKILKDHSNEIYHFIEDPEDEEDNDGGAVVGDEFRLPTKKEPTVDISADIKAYVDNHFSDIPIESHENLVGLPEFPPKAFDQDDTYDNSYDKLIGEKEYDDILGSDWRNDSDQFNPLTSAEYNTLLYKELKAQKPKPTTKKSTKTTTTSDTIPEAKEFLLDAKLEERVRKEREQYEGKKKTTPKIEISPEKLAQINYKLDKGFEELLSPTSNIYSKIISDPKLKPEEILQKFDFEQEFQSTFGNQEEFDQKVKDFLSAGSDLEKVIKENKDKKKQEQQKNKSNNKKKI